MGPTPVYGARAEKPLQNADFAMKQTNICRLSGDITMFREARTHVVTEWNINVNSSHILVYNRTVDWGRLWCIHYWYTVKAMQHSESIRTRRFIQRENEIVFLLCCIRNVGGVDFCWAMMLRRLATELRTTESLNHAYFISSLLNVSNCRSLSSLFIPMTSSCRPNPSSRQAGKSITWLVIT